MAQTALTNRRGEALMRMIGNTPLIPLEFELEDRTIWVKCEFLNPSGSIKDRLARTIVQDAQQRNLLNADSIILECTSGNTGIAFAMVGAACGYAVSIVMSERASGERRRIIQHFGAELILFAESGYQFGIEMTKRMAAADSRYFLPRQFENPLNALDHQHETGYGTGGTLAGCSRALLEANSSTRIYAMEPAESALLAGEEACCHWIEGIAGGFIPPLLQGVRIDGTKKVSSPDAIAMTRRLNCEFGLLVGSSSGANVAAALEIARNLPKESIVVTFLCDRAERYFSTRLFEC
jgi:cysteine synthase